MTPSISRLLRALPIAALTLTTLPVLAEQADSAPPARPFAGNAPLSPEERRALRERWEQADPEERMRMRQFFRNRMRHALPDPSQLPLPPAARDAPRMLSPGGWMSPDGGFGFGFERRRFRDEPPERPLAPDDDGRR